MAGALNYQPEDTKIKPWFPIGPLCPHKDDLSERRATGYMFRKSSKVPGKGQAWQRAHLNGERTELHQKEYPRD